MLDTDQTATRRRLTLPWRSTGAAAQPDRAFVAAAAPAAARGGRSGRVRRGGGDERGTYDLRNSWQVVVGSLLIPLGVVFIVLGWYGAAHAKVVQQQIPYMVSGSFGGLGCLFVGGMLFWGHWLYRVYDQADLHHHEQQQLLETLIRTISASPASGAAPGSVATAAAVGGMAAEYYATASGTVFHRSGCPVIAHHPTDLRVLGPETVGGLRPCQICDPTSSES
jgi:hypothetical protein